MEIVADRGADRLLEDRRCVVGVEMRRLRHIGGLDRLPEVRDGVLRHGQDRLAGAFAAGRLCGSTAGAMIVRAALECPSYQGLNLQQRVRRGLWVVEVVEPAFEAHLRHAAKHRSGHDDRVVLQKVGDAALAQVPADHDSEGHVDPADIAVL